MEKNNDSWIHRPLGSAPVLRLTLIPSVAYHDPMSGRISTGVLHRGGSTWTVSEQIRCSNEPAQKEILGACVILGSGMWTQVLP